MGEASSLRRGPIRGVLYAVAMSNPNFTLGGEHAGAVRYAVTAEIDDRAVAQWYILWLLNGHAAAVLAWGGTRAEVCVLDRDGGDDGGAGPARVECRYEFPDRATLEQYLREGAPLLREEGRRLFLDQGGVRLSRSVGVVVGEVGTAKLTG